MGFLVCRKNGGGLYPRKRSVTSARFAYSEMASGMSFPITVWISKPYSLAYWIFSLSMESASGSLPSIPTKRAMGARPGGVFPGSTSAGFPRVSFDPGDTVLVCPGDIPVDCPGESDFCGSGGTVPVWIGKAVLAAVLITRLLLGEEERQTMTTGRGAPPPCVNFFSIPVRLPFVCACIMKLPLYE